MTQKNAHTGNSAFGLRPNGDLARTVALDVVDAEFETVLPVDATDRIAVTQPDAPPISTPAADPAPPEGMNILRSGAFQATSAEPKPAGPAFWAIGVAVAATAFWVSGGHALVSRFEPHSAVAKESGIRIASVISRVDRSGNVPLLLVDGRAVNDGVAPVVMPPLNIQVVSEKGGSTLYRMGTAGSQVDTGSSFAFSSRLDLPKDGVRTVFVTFAE